MNIKSTKTNIEMAEVLEKYGKLFQDLPEQDVNMDNGEYPDNYSQASVGEHIALFNIEKGKKRKTYYSVGAQILANEMGFQDSEELEIFFYKSPTLWGNEEGDLLFYHNCAYDEGDKKYTAKNITSTAVSIKLYSVAKRLRELKE